MFRLRNSDRQKSAAIQSLKTRGEPNENENPKAGNSIFCPLVRHAGLLSVQAESDIMIGFQGKFVDIVGTLRS
jgi:hypothetical protein